jgi:hypothetical protein
MSIRKGFDKKIMHASLREVGVLAKGTQEPIR